MMCSFQCTASRRALASILAGWLAIGSAALARAEDASPSAAPAPYSLPLQLRPAVASTVIRLDTALAFYEDPVSHDSGVTLVPLLLGSYKLSDQLAVLARIGAASDSPPAGASGFAILNPVLGATYALKPAAPLRLAFFLGVALPFGSGGGDDPDPAQKAARIAGVPARSALDNAMFAVNDLTIFPGVDLAYVADGLTLQLEATLLQLTRVRGASDQPDSARTNFTAGVHVGYFFVPALSAAVELRHQRWLSTPKQIEADSTGALRDTTTLAFGPRVHFKLAQGVSMHPALALVLPLDDPMAARDYRIVQLDLPVAF